MAPVKKKKPSKKAPAKGGSKKRPLKKKTGGAARPKGPKGPKKSKGPKFPPRPLVANEEGLKAAREIAQTVVDRKGLDVVLIDVRGKASYADYIVVASADNERAVAALAEGVEEKMKASNQRPIGREGNETGNWVLLDYGDVVAHLFHQDARGFYDLEGLWADAPRERFS